MRLKKLMIASLCVSLISASTLLSACSSKSDGASNTTSEKDTTIEENQEKAQEESEENEDSTNTADITKFDITVEYKDKQLNTAYDESAATKIELSDSGIQVDGSGATVEDGTVTITKAGTYVISGSVSDGQIVVDSEEEGYVWLVLNNANITNQSSSAIYVKNADNTLITLPEGTKNEVTDGKEYVFEGDDTSLNAAIYSKDDLFINGTGSLTVNGNYNHGIQSKDDLVIISGTISVQSTGDGIIGKDSVVIKEAEIVINAGGDGIKATNATQDKGYIYLDNPNITIVAGNDGIQAETCMVIEKGTYDITTGGGSSNASAKENGEFNQGWGNWGGDRSNTNGDMTPPQNKSNSSDNSATGISAITSENQTADSSTDSTTTTSDSAKGLKAGVDITINGGTFVLDCSDDTIHTNNSITISDGKITAASGDDGMHSDTILTINGGDIEITKSYEGIESSDIYINGGTITLTASDDGFNAAGGSDSSSVSGRPGQNQFSGAGDYTMTFNGGTVQVYASGDGLDSNGTIIVNGGTIYVDGPTSGGDSALDYETGLEINGGTLLTVGSIGMAESPTGGTQYSVMVNLDATCQAGTKLVIKDSTGNAVLTYTPSKVYQSIVFSTDTLKNGETYGVYVDDELKSTVTISSTVTVEGEGGMSGGNRGMNGGGGRGATRDGGF